ncbi:hypothetical protein [Paraburkholderia sp.]
MAPKHRAFATFSANVKQVERASVAEEIEIFAQMMGSRRRRP